MLDLGFLMRKVGACASARLNVRAFDAQPTSAPYSPPPTNASRPRSNVKRMPAAGRVSVKCFSIEEGHNQ